MQYTLGRYFTTHLMQTGTDIRTMLERLGHACLATTFSRLLALGLGVYKLLLSKPRIRRADAGESLQPAEAV